MEWKIGRCTCAVFFRSNRDGRFVLKVFENGSKGVHLDLQVFCFLKFVFDRTQARFAWISRITLRDQRHFGWGLRCVILVPNCDLAMSLSLCFGAFSFPPKFSLTLIPDDSAEFAFRRSGMNKIEAGYNLMISCRPSRNLEVRCGFVKRANAVLRGDPE